MECGGGGVRLGSEVGHVVGPSWVGRWGWLWWVVVEVKASYLGFPDLISSYSPPLFFSCVPVS